MPGPWPAQELKGTTAVTICQHPSHVAFAAAVKAYADYWKGTDAERQARIDIATRRVDQHIKKAHE